MNIAALVAFALGMMGPSYPGGITAPRPHQIRNAQQVRIVYGDGTGASTHVGSWQIKSERVIIPVASMRAYGEGQCTGVGTNDWFGIGSAPQVNHMDVMCFSPWGLTIAEIIDPSWITFAQQRLLQ